MPIKQYDPTTGQLTQVCAACAAVRTVAVDSLQLGNDHGGDVIQMPPCGCGASEHLMRNWDDAPEATKLTPFGAHRRLVNVVAVDMVNRGLVHGASVRTDSPPDLLPNAQLYEIKLHPALEARLPKE